MSTTPILDQAPSDRAALHQLDMAVQFGHLPTPRGLRFGDDHSVTVDCHTRADFEAWSGYFDAAGSRETPLPPLPTVSRLWLHAYTFDWHGRYVSVDAMLDVPAAVPQLPCTLPPCTLPRADGRLFCTEHAALADKGIGAPVIPCRKCETGSGCHMYTAGCDLYRAQKMEPVEVPDINAQAAEAWRLVRAETRTDVPLVIFAAKVLRDASPKALSLIECRNRLRWVVLQAHGQALALNLLPSAAISAARRAAVPPSYDEQTRDAHPRADLRSYDPAASFAVVVRAAEQVRAVAEALLGETAGGES